MSLGGSGEEGRPDGIHPVRWPYHAVVVLVEELNGLGEVELRQLLVKVREQPRLPPGAGCDFVPGQEGLAIDLAVLGRRVGQLDERLRTGGGCEGWRGLRGGRERRGRARHGRTCWT